MKLNATAAVVIIPSRSFLNCTIPFLAFVVQEFLFPFLPCARNYTHIQTCITGFSPETHEKARFLMVKDQFFSYGFSTFVWLNCKVFATLLVAQD